MNTMLSPRLALLPYPSSPYQADIIPFPIPHFFSCAAEQDLRSVLEKPGRFWVEITSPRQPEANLDMLFEKMPELGLSLSSHRAYHSSTAAIVTQALINRFSLPADIKDNVMTCLQEALSNAVIHGNLGIEGMIDSITDMEKYYQAVESRIKQEPYCSSRIVITASHSHNRLTLRVTDEGRGFTLTPAYSSPAATAKSGRGLFIIRSLASGMWIGKDQKTLCMSFTL